MSLTPHAITSPAAERVFTIEAPLEDGQTLTLRYVPDREMIKCEHFQDWLKKQVKDNTATLEELTTHIGSHFYDKVLPRYMDLKIKFARDNGLTSYSYFVHHQPEYKLPQVLSNIFNRY